MLTIEFVKTGQWYTLSREEPCRKREASLEAGREGGAVKALLLVAGVFFASAAFARQIVIPTLPVSPFADTEVSTNVVIHGSRTDVRDVRIHFQLEGTPTNNLEVAFGCDANTATSSRTSAHGRGLKRLPLRRHCAESSTFSCITTNTSSREALPRRAAVNRLSSLFPPRLHRHGSSGMNGTWCASSGVVRERSPSGCGATSNTIPSLSG